MLKNLVSRIPSHVRLLFKLYFLSLFLFFIIRLLFYLINHSGDTAGVPFFEKLMAFRMGLEFDTAVFSWIALLPVLFWSVAFFSKKLSPLYTIGYYGFLILLTIYFFICCADIPCFGQFGSHLNKNALLWNESPGFVLGIIFGSFSYWGYLLLFLASTIILWKWAGRSFSSFQKEMDSKAAPRWFVPILWLALLGGLVTIGGRGRTSDRSGLHEGLSIVSQNNFVNQVAINPNFTFWKTVLYNKNKQPYSVPPDIDKKIALTRNYLGIRSPYAQNISRPVEGSAKHRYNFVIVIMESMSVFKMGYYNGKNLCPQLTEIIKHSVFCQNFFSSGIHTFNGLFSTTSGYPSIYAEKSMKSYVKNPFDGLGVMLSGLGYDSYMYTTHDPHFDNMLGFFTLNKFKHSISQYDFSFSQAESSLGVPDHLLFDKLIETTNKRNNSAPFVSVLMTASDHGPWKIPTDIPFKPNGENAQDNCTLYADWSIGRFIEQAKKCEWFDNTIFFFLGDHGLSLGHTYEMPLSYNHVPCVIYQPSVLKPDTIFSPCYQPDIPATVMGLTGEPYTNTTFGVDILKDKHPYVVFSADDKIGCVDNNGFYYYKTLSNGQRYLRKYKTLDPVNYITQYPQKADSMERNITGIYETANYFIRKNYLMYE